MRAIWLVIIFIFCSACSASGQSNSCSRDAVSHRVAKLYFLAQAESVDAVAFYEEQSVLRSDIAACRKIGAINVPMLGSFSEVELMVIADDVESLMRLRKQDLLAAVKAENMLAPLMHLAAAFSSPKTVQYLINVGANPIVQDRFGNYATAAACNSAPGREKIVDVLRSHGVTGDCQIR